MRTQQARGPDKSHGARVRRLRPGDEPAGVGEEEAAGGPLDTFYEQEGGPLGIWRKWANNVQGQAIKGGHFFPEENPTETTELLKRFLSV